MRINPLPQIIALIFVLASAAAGAAADELSRETLFLETSDRTYEFTVEMAVSQQEQRQGLMFREHLGDREGMLFPFDEPQPTSFWMKNTLIPLDMLFIDKTGRIIKIARMTRPKSERNYRSRRPVLAVLELRGGLCDELGVVKGDRVLHRTFGNLEAAPTESAQGEAGETP